ncbi:MAG: hypothetical protein KGI54_08810 [Pseudomonadota bacterium]|nr:hypothetical protein [Pseudomonadota bacterium]
MNFEKDALGFLIRFAQLSHGKPFCSEDVTLSAIDRGIAPPDLRHWGKIFNQAAKDGYIRRSNTVHSRSMGHSTKTLGWVST